MNRIYYSFQELLDQVQIENVSMPRFPHDMEMSSAWFTSLIEEYDLEVAVYTLSEIFDDDLINEIINALMGIVYNRHAEDFIAMLEDEEDYSKALRQALIKIINVIDITLPKYIPMLQQNEYASACPITPNLDEYSEESNGDNHSDYNGENSSDTSGTNRENDTPQDGGDYADDEHTSNIVQSQNHIDNENSFENNGNYTTKTNKTNSTNVGTLMSRLVEMYNNFESIILKWSNDFNQLFFKEEQL